MSETRIPVVRVQAASAPSPGLLRPALEAALAGRPWPGPEGEVARAVVAAAERARRDAWR